MISKVQEMRTIIRNKRGERKVYTKKAIFLSKMFEKILRLERGDEIEFAINFDKMEKGTFRIIRKRKILENSL